MKKYTSLGIAVLLALSSNVANAVCSCSSSYAGKYEIVTKNLPLGLRQGHSSTSLKLGTIAKGTIIYVTEGNGTWAHVTYKGVSGHVAMQYLKKVDSNTPINPSIDNPIEVLPEIETKPNTPETSENVVENSSENTVIPEQSESKYLRGDVDEDGQVTVADFARLQNYMVDIYAKNPNPIKINKRNSDVDEDGQITYDDVLFIQDWVKGNNIKGDVNNNGKIDNYDLNTFRLFFEKKTTCDLNRYNADLNNDYKVTQEDMDLLKEMLNKESNNKPEVEPPAPIIETQPEVPVTPEPTTTEVEPPAPNIETQPEVPVTPEPVPVVVEVPTYYYPMEGWYRIASSNVPSKGLDVIYSDKGNGTNIILYDYNDTNNQKFYLKEEGDGYLSIKAGHCDMYLDAANGSSANGTNIQLYEWNGSDAQRWRLREASSNIYYIESKLNENVVFNCAEGASANNTNIQLWNKGNIEGNKWLIIKVSEPVISEVVPTDPTPVNIIEYAKRYVLVYTDTSLNVRQNDQFLGYGEEYTVLEDLGNILHVEFYNNSKTKRYSGYVSADVRTEDTNNWPGKVGQQLANISSSHYASGTNPFSKSYTDRNGKYHSTNCTWYAWGRMREVTGKAITFSVSSGRNGGNWHNVVSNCSVSHSVVDKSVGERDGHVIFVEAVVGDTVYYSEANVNSSTDLKIRSMPLGTFNSKYSWFIY